MKIVIVSPVSVPAVRYGGTERVVWSLAIALQRAGHQVTIIAPPSPAAAGGNSVATVIPRVAGQPLENLIPADTDVVHFHDAPPAPGFPFPYIVTIHGNGLPSAGADRNMVFLSRNHAERHGSSQWVYNGLDWSLYPAPPAAPMQRSGYHFLGKAAWRVKNLRGAIALTRHLGTTLEVMGGYRFNFKMGIRLTFDRHVHFHGMVDDAVKARIASSSRGLLFPVLWDEPFGLAVIESMYYGAPVFATTRGSLPELVTADTGILAPTVDDLEQALRSDPSFSAEACHDRALHHFSADRMAADYLEKYAVVMSGQQLSSTLPRCEG